MLWQGTRQDRFWDPFREMDRLRDEMNRLVFWPRWAGETPEFPVVNVWTGPESATLTMELPGVDPKEVDISVVGDTLTVKGERKPEELGKEVTYHRQERQFGSFARTVQLPFDVDTAKVDASFRKGVLYVTLPRTEAEKPRKITVRTS